jgi:5-methylcytosine-specific restriction protein A
MLVRLCPACGCHLPYPGRGKCRDCQREYERKRTRSRGTRKQRGYTEQWLQLVKVAIAHHPYCSACGSTTDLTGDHRIPLSKGGTSTLENIEVLCRSCNSAKGAREKGEPGFLREGRRTPHQTFAKENR